MAGFNKQALIGGLILAAVHYGAHYLGATVPIATVVVAAGYYLLVTNGFK